MKIQVNTDVHSVSNEAQADWIRALIEKALERFQAHVTRVEVHLSDENGSKTGPNDQRCMLEARLEGRQPVAVTERGATLEQAVQGAAQKMVHLLESTFGRLHEHRDKSSRLPMADPGPAQK